MKALKKLPLFLVLFVGLIGAGQTFAQQETHPGVKLYLAGKYDEAIASLTLATKEKDLSSNGEIWNYLGLAYVSKTDYGAGQKAIEKAVSLTPSSSTFRSNLAYVQLLLRKYGPAKNEAKKAIELDPKNVNAYYIRGSISIQNGDLKDALADADKVIELDPGFASAYLLKSNASLAMLSKKLAAGSEPKAEISYLRDAVDTLKVGKEKAKDTVEKTAVDEALKSAEAFYEYFSREKGESTDLEITTSDPSVTPLKIISMAKPNYPAAARKAGLLGKVKLVVLFGASGKVEYVLIMSHLGSGLDEEAAFAARKIQYEPMKHDGVAVSVVKMITFEFADR